jgi:hypothetical protein
MAFNKLSLLEKLLTKAEWAGECLIWTGQKCTKGYGRLRLNGKLQRAHRLMYELHCKEIPAGSVIMHSCDNPACINIAHLSAGTQLENIRDMRSKGRAVFNRGADNHMSKISAVQVEEIRLRYKPKCRKDGACAIAREFNVHRTTIEAVIHMKSWSNP